MAQWAFGEQSIFDLAAGRGYEINVAGSPLSVVAPIGIDEKSLKLPQAVEESLEAVEDESDETEWDEEQP